MRQVVSIDFGKQICLFILYYPAAGKDAISYRSRFITINFNYQF